jgi:outer membrane protein OmpA-like peptidoglycan-associated protein
MMAFFLLMWLLGSVTKGDLQGIADYFRTPLKVSLSGGTGAGDSTALIKAGGKDLTRADDQQMRRGEMPPKKQVLNAAVARAAVEREDGQRLKALKGRVEEVIDLNPLLRQYRNQLLVDITSEGLRIQIVDELNRPMFDLGSAQLKPYARDILAALSPTLNGVPNSISLTGHTDGKPYASGERGATGAVGRSAMLRARCWSRWQTKEVEARGRHVLRGPLRRQRSRPGGGASRSSSSRGRPRKPSRRTAGGSNKDNSEPASWCSRDCVRRWAGNVYNR